MYGSPLTLPGELVDVPELPPESFLRNVDRTIEGFAVPLPHHVLPVPPSQLPSVLLTAKFVFVREDAVIPTLAPCYRGPYLVLERMSKYFRIQIGSKQDVVSVDRLKPVFSDAPVTPALPPPCGRPSRHPVASSSDPPPSSAILRHPPPHKYPRESCFNSFLKFFLHLNLHIGILTGLQGIEGSVPPRLRHSFWGDYCGGYESRPSWRIL